MAAGMATEGTRVRAVLLDGMGTLLRLRPPAPALAERLGVDLATAERAFRAEVAYYLEHQLDGSDTAGLADLRARSARVLARAAGVDEADALGALMESLRFEAFPDAAPALSALRERGLRLVVVSNWDCALPEILAGIGLRPLVDAVVTSAETGAPKPSPRIFAAALAAAGIEAPHAVHVGDSVEHDVAGARAAGIRAVLLDRDGAAPDPPGVERVRSLYELAALLS
jgi:putative hydrolase of the HAD superfamily